MQEGLDHATDAAVPSMDEAAVVQSAPDGDATPSTDGQTPGGTPDTHPEEYTPEQIAAWRADSENKSAWQKAQTQRDQELAERRRQLEAERQGWLQDPLTMRLMEARNLMLQDPSFAKEVDQYVATQGRQDVDPLTSQLAVQLRHTQDQLRAIQYERQEADRQRVEEATLAHVTAFREKHEEFGEGPEGDAAFQAFYDRAMRETDVADLEDAYLLLERDKVLARERERARAELAGVKADQLAASTGIQPGAAEPEDFTGFRNDPNFRKTRERAMQHDNTEWEE